MLQRTLVVGASSDLGQPFCPRQKSWVWGEIGYLVTTFALKERERERNVLFNDALNTFYFTVIWRHTYG